MTIRRHYELIRAVAVRHDGQTMAEYGVLLAVTTLVVAGAMTALAVAISGGLGSVTHALANVV
jgi:Flp pilus assembly pilin Flp